jgi:hypothetical protein
MKRWKAEYKTPIGKLINIEFDHDFESVELYFDAWDQVTGIVYLNLYVGYLIRSTLAEV